MLPSFPVSPLLFPFAFCPLIALHPLAPLSEIVFTQLFFCLAPYTRGLRLNHNKSLSSSNEVRSKEWRKRSLPKTLAVLSLSHPPVSKRAEGPSIRPDGVMLSSHSQLPASDRELFLLYLDQTLSLSLSFFIFFFLCGQLGAGKSR